MTLPPQILPSTTPAAGLLLPAADLFARRATRLRHLAHGHSMAEWLNWLAGLAEAQQKSLDSLTDCGLRASLPFSPEPPVLNADLAVLQKNWQAVHAELSAATLAGAPASIDTLQQKAASCLALAAGHGELSQRDADDLLVAAALQVAWTGAARHLGLPPIGNTLGDRETCPCCGSLPVGSIVMAGDGMAGLRYLECSLCATRWNAVRARCTLCADGHVVNYLGLEGSSGAVQAETCETCHGYIKTCFQNKDIAVDPLADDLASLALDVLVGEQGFARGTPNLFLGEGDSV
ncbi:MAG: formate dehydrogenase accessory protein FdhE [Azonexus sp.]